MTRTTLAAAMVLACSILLSSGAIAQGPQLPPNSPPRDRATGHATDVVLVKFREAVRITNSRGAPATGKVELDRLLSDQGVQQADRLMPGGQGPYVSSAKTFGLDRIYRLRLASGRDPVEVVAALAADPGVEYAEPDFEASAADVPEAPPPLPVDSAPSATVPNDPLYADQWGLSAINAATAWEVVTGTPTIVIAVVDSGIDANHEDLIPNLWVNPGEIPGNGIDDDNNGYVDDIQGWNFVSGSNDVQDGRGHGTQVAGVAAAATNNGAGVAGMCWNCRIMPVKVMADSGVANYSDIAAGVAYAAAKGASIINLSLGGYADSRTLRDAIAAAVAQGIVVVAGAGNDGISTPFYPAAYPNVLAVAATTVSDTLAPSSNRGAWVSVAAPGVAISTTYLGGGYGAASGTSMAAPLASGLAGLIRSRWPAWTEAMVRSQIRQTAGNIDTLNPGYEGQMGQGRINAAAAMQDPYPVLTVSGIAVNGDPLGRPTPGQTATLAVTLRNDWWDATATTASLSTADSYVTLFSNSSSFGTITTGAAAESTPVYSFTVASGAGYNHPIPFSLSIKVDGIAYGAALPFTITTRSSEEQIPARTLTDTVWTRDKTYVVNGNISVASGYTMTIQPGTEVRFSSNYTLSVGGTLIADGTADQPIVFRPYAPGGAWNRIYFRDSSADAIVDSDGNYQSGTILRHVQVLGATSGLVCGGATPYLSHLTTSTGGINCTMGASDFWLLDSSVAGTVSLSGRAHLWRDTLSGGTVMLGNQSEVLTSTLRQGLSIIGHGTVAGSTLAGNITADTGSFVGNWLSGGSISVSGQVLSNTLRGGGISASGMSVVSGNDVESAPGVGIATSFTATVTGNRVVGSGGTGIVACCGLVQGNLVANNAGLGLELGNAAVLSNTFTGNLGSAIRISSGVPSSIFGNNLEGNKGAYDMENATAQLVQAAGNWWGITNVVAIGVRIYDWWDGDESLGEVDATPFLTGPVATAPAYIRAVGMTPSSPVGIESAGFDIQFSREMDAEVGVRTAFESTDGLIWVGMRSMLSTGTEFATAACANGTIWVIGVSGTEAEVEEYDPSTDTWTVRASLPYRRWKLGAACAGNGLLYAVGGITILGNPVILPLVQAYDPHTNTWSDRASMPTAREGLGVALARNGKIYAIGGDNQSRYFDNVEEYDPDTNTWSIRAPMPTARTGLGVTVADDGRIYAVGGSNGTALSTVEVYDPSTDTWETAAGMPSGRWNLGLAAPGNGNIYAIGGADSANALLSTVLAYSPTSAKWSNARPMTTARANLGVAAPSDTIYAIGGSGTSGRLSSVEMSTVPTQLPPAPDGEWSTNLRFFFDYEFTSLVPTGIYSLAVSGARGADGIEIAPYSDFTFTVDYAGAVTDKTPPLAPAVSVDICRNSITSAAANWLAQDAESGIDLYSYALGVTSGGTEVVNWTTTPLTTVVRSGLNLLAGQRYYFSVKARNAAGLWSPPASVPFLAGVACQRVYLPLVLRGR
jgi:subtilisin family serine protease/N-acetylneuraminic acid mutarotase